jgi:hypothetical protein
MKMITQQLEEVAVLLQLVHLVLLLLVVVVAAVVLEVVLEHHHAQYHPLLQQHQTQGNWYSPLPTTVFHLSIVLQIVYIVTLYHHLRAITLY